MVGVGNVVASAFTGWTYASPSSAGVTVGATVDSISSCPTGLIAAGSGTEPPSRIFRFGSSAIDLSSKIGRRALEVSVAGVAYPRADVELALISY
ncbi:hypothetical protein ACOSP7_018679 [Xanthoceras sorbifolium]